MTELEIEAFLAIVKNGSISAAAQELYVTQPALSRRIGALEQELGYCLMNRKKGVRSIELTREGKAFISLAEKWREMWNETRQIGTLGSRQSLHIGSVGSISTYLLPEALAGFMEQNPDCPLVFRQYHSGESYEHVEKEEVDLAFISDDMYSHSVDTVPFFSGKMVLLATDWREKQSALLIWIPKRKYACPGIRNMICGMITGSVPAPEPGYCWTRCRLWNIFSGKRAPGLSCRTI